MTPNSSKLQRNIPSEKVRHVLIQHPTEDTPFIGAFNTYVHFLTDLLFYHGCFIVGCM